MAGPAAETGETASNQQHVEEEELHPVGLGNGYAHPYPNPNDNTFGIVPDESNSEQLPGNQWIPFERQAAEPVESDRTNQTRLGHRRYPIVSVRHPGPQNWPLSSNQQVESTQ